MSQIRPIIRRPELWIVLLFLSLPCLAFPELLFQDQTLYWTDLSWIHYPRHIFAAEEWLAGRIPLWDPYEHSGIPLLAETQVGVLYPLSILFLTSLSPSLELSLFILIHFSLAAIFTFILARSLSLSRSSATLAGLSYGLGGYLMAQLPNLNIMTGAVWLPLILYGLIQTARYRKWFVALLAGVPLTLQILTAQPQIVFYTLVTMVGFALYQLATDFLARRSARYILQTTFLIGMTIFTGLLLAAPQLLPTLELQQLSVRSQERGLGFLTENSLPPAMWLNLILPSAFGNNVTSFKGGDPFQEVFIYGGLIPLILIFFSKGQNKFFLWLLGGGALLAMGGYTPLYEYLIQYLPGFDLFRIPSRWLMVVNLALAVLAGYGLESLKDKGVSRSAWLTLLISHCLLLITIILIWIFKTDLITISSHKLITVFLEKSFIFAFTSPAVILIFNLIAATIFFALFVYQRLNGQAFSLCLIGITAIDLMMAGGTTINPTQPASWWHQLSGGAKYVLENLEKNERVFPLGMGSEEAAVSHLGQYFPSVYHVLSAGGHGSSLQIARSSTFLDETDPVQAIQVLGVRYLLTLGQMGADVAATYPLAYRDQDGFVYENPMPLSRFFLVHEAIQVQTSEEALAYFQGRSIDPQYTVILEAESAPSLDSTSVSEGDRLTIIQQTPQSLEIAVQTEADGYLVLLDSYYPGWIATLDGESTPIYRANYIARAVFVPSGEHVITLEYKPLSFWIGVWVAISMGLIIVVISWLRI